MKKSIKEDIINGLKGIAIGTANVIPGVSGATLAIITGVFERLVNAVKSVDITAIRLFFTGKIKKFAAHVDLRFLTALLAGVAVAIITLARIFEFLFEKYPVYIWAYFFGLILASIYFVGRTVKKWNPANIALFAGGTAFAVALTLFNPAVENSNMLYVFICGVIAICSMILPGISGSFILILMGNYTLLIKSINSLDLAVLIPFALGCGIGLLGFAHILSWILKKFRDGTIATLTGFICGSLLIIWPWKKIIYLTDALGVIIERKGEKVIKSYQAVLPDSLNGEVIIAVLIMAAGIASIWITEYIANKK